MKGAKVDVREALAALGKLEGVAGKKQRVGALMEGGLLVEREAKQICPVDKGKLRASIKAEADGEVVRVGPHTEYAAAVEFGTARMAAQPYMRPPLDSQKRGIIRAVVGYFVREVRKRI